jgi:hypothetical protein
MQNPALSYESAQNPAPAARQPRFSLAWYVPAILLAIGCRLADPTNGLWAYGYAYDLLERLTGIFFIAAVVYIPSLAVARFAWWLFGSIPGIRDLPHPVRLVLKIISLALIIMPFIVQEVFP